jgi:hypothetical protein
MEEDSLLYSARFFQSVPACEANVRPRFILLCWCEFSFLVWLGSPCQSQISVFPYTQNFDSIVAPNLPLGWSSTQNRTPGVDDFTTTTSTSQSPPNAVLSTNATISQSLTSSLFDFRNQVPDRLAFHTRRTATHLARVVVEASTDSGTTFPFLVGDSLTNPGSTNYTASSILLPNFLAHRNGVKFRWRVVADAGGSQGTFRMDDITVTVQTLYDLAVSAMGFSPPAPIEQDSITATAFVRNIGLQIVPSFVVNFYDDVNNDSIPQSAELVTVTSHTIPLEVSDSVEVSAYLGRFNAGERNIIAQVVYQPDQNPQNDRMRSILRVGYHPQSVVVNEIMYAPTNTEPEWVELFNTRGDSINVKNWLVSDNNVATKRLIAPSHLEIPPLGYLVLTKDSAALLDVHPGIPSRVVNVSGFPTLNNTGDAVVLYDSRVVAMDSVAYLPGWGGNGGGKSLERIDPLGPSVLQTNWNSSRSTERSTPGRRNSISRKDNDLVLDVLTISPPFPVNGDSIVATIKVRNSGFQQATSYALKLFADFNNDSLAQPNELLFSVLSYAPLAPLDSLIFSFAPLLVRGNDQFLIGVVSFLQDEDSSNNTTFTHVRVGYRKGSVAISEIMYSPVGEPEWVEFYNATAESIDVKDWRISNRATATRYSIAASSIGAPPRAYAIITKDTALLIQRYGRMHGLLLQVPSLPTFLFNNSGDAAVLFDNRDLQMDSVKYMPTWGGSAGTSLERIDLLEAPNDSSNWTSSTDSMRATPGRENSVAALDQDLRALKSAALVSHPHATVSMLLTVKNVGRLSSAEFDVAFFDDRDFDSVAVPAEVVARVHIVQSLSRGETVRVVTQWQDPPSGVHNVIACVEYPPDQRTSDNSTIFTARIGYEQGIVVINEIMYAPFANEAEYVELVNMSTQDVDLSGWRLSDRPGSSGTVNEFPLISHGRLLHPGEFFVIASDSSIFSRFHCLDTMQLRFVSVANQSSLGLNNDGDDVIIRDATLSTIDSVAYSPKWHNASVADATGRSLERIHPNLRSDDARSWSTCVATSGGTPGVANSIFTAVRPPHAKVSCSPNPFSPDGDGIEDFSVIHTELPIDVATISVRLYDVKGRLIRTLISNEPSGASRDIAWDGYDDERQRARVGIYVVLLEGLNEGGGMVYTAKGVVVLGARL